MNQFTSKDIENYYDQTEIHYKMFWKLEEAAGLHYGIWDASTKSTSEAILNTNRYLINLGGIKKVDKVLDAGCGIGGSSIFIAKNVGCTVHGITLSKKQAETARLLAQKNNLDHLVEFSHINYLDTGFDNESFDVVWAIESFGSSPDKSLFFKEMKRILKPGGTILFADTFKPKAYDITKNKNMQVMLNGWAISDILSIEDLKSLAYKYDFEVTQVRDVTKQIRKSVNIIYYASILGFFGTKLYNLFKKASYFSRIHYTTGLAQKKAYKKGDWGYYLVVCEKKIV
jgi:cyclopropane fatty-acyl-phospholipid synthase-like methyltransferase